MAQNFTLLSEPHVELGIESVGSVRQGNSKEKFLTVVFVALANNYFSSALWKTETDTKRIV